MHRLWLAARGLAEREEVEEARVRYDPEHAHPALLQCASAHLHEAAPHDQRRGEGGSHAQPRRMQVVSRRRPSELDDAK